MKYTIYTKTTPMKNTTKRMASVATAVSIFLSLNVKAQSIDVNKFRFGIGVEAGVPTGDTRNASNFELGGTARLQYGLSNKLALTLTTGYYNFFVNNYNYTYSTPYPNITLKGRDIGVLPIKAGIKAFFSPNVYLSAEAGAAITVHPVFAGGYHETNLILSPGVGYASKSWDVGLRYENFSGQGSSDGLVALRIAYGFAL